MFYIGDLFQWERFITPSIIKLFYWLVVIIVILAGLSGLGGRLLFGPNLLEEYELLRSHFRFDDARIAGIARTSIEASGAPDEVKRPALAGIEAWLAS